MPIAQTPKGYHDSRYRALIRLFRDARMQLGLSQGEFADRVGRRQQFVSLYERGERRLDVTEFVDVARALELDPAGLIADLPDFDREAAKRFMVDGPPPKPERPQRRRRGRAE